MDNRIINCISDDTKTGTSCEAPVFHLLIITRNKSFSYYFTLTVPRIALASSLSKATLAPEMRRFLPFTLA